MTLPSPVGIVGLGLMGGSLARALSKSPDAPELLGWSANPQDLELAAAVGAIGRAAGSPEEVAREAAVVVYAVPLGAIMDMLTNHRKLWRSDAVITDLSGLKAPVTARARAAGAERRFVGSHPMTGGERSGFGAAREDLYRGVPVWITEDTGDAECRGVVEALWLAVGAVPRRVSAAQHDQRIVWASHLPQLTANALANVLREQGLTRADLGPGGRDMTRLAASSPPMWLDLLDAAGPTAAKALDTLGGTLHRLARDLREGRRREVAELMEATKRWTADPAPDPKEPPEGGPS